MGWFFNDYRVSPNFLLCWGWVVVEVGLGCDNFEISTEPPPPFGLMSKNMPFFKGFPSFFFYGIPMERFQKERKGDGNLTLRRAVDAPESTSYL